MAGEWITKANWEALNKRWVQMESTIAALERELKEALGQLRIEILAKVEIVQENERLREDTIMLCYRTAKMGCICGTCDPCEIAKMILALRDREALAADRKKDDE